ncbi:K+-transporting ATPase subunit C family protein [Brochothrix thermosphacta DSM 20171 = FSL F6-1036]|nr:K+-transporting ATPase subunit C family protein [Brochothrix thermosphacta DSM 20171 = FSL F6-1036]
MKIIKEIMMPGLKMLLVWTVICGVMYTLLLTGIGQLFFSEPS